MLKDESEPRSEVRWRISFPNLMKTHFNKKELADNNGSFDNTDANPEDEFIKKATEYVTNFRNQRIGRWFKNRWEVVLARRK